MPDGRSPNQADGTDLSLKCRHRRPGAGLRDRGVHFRNDIVEGVGGKQILLEDPAGNPIELFEPGIPEARLVDR